MSEDTVTVCDRCGSTTCVGKDVCAYDGLPHGEADVPAVKLERQSFLQKAIKK